MSKIDSAANEIREIEELAAKKSPVHSLHPLAKLFTTMAFIFVTVSFNKYDLSGLFIMILYPVILFSVAGLSMQKCFYRMRFVLPLVMAVGLFNPFFDTTPMLKIGTVTLTGGVISMLTLMLKGILCLMASYALASTTSMDALCAALRRIHVPDMPVTLLLLTYRYIQLMLEEVGVMYTAYMLRAPGQKGLHYKAWGSFLGQLLLRSMDRAEEIYSAMQLRGFNGNFYYAKVKKASVADWIYAILAVFLFVLCRYYNITLILGGLITGGNK